VGRGGSIQSTFPVRPHFWETKKVLLPALSLPGKADISSKEESRSAALPGLFTGFRTMDVNSKLPDTPLWMFYSITVYS
jgi:hypothetical protein